MQFAPLLPRQRTVGIVGGARLRPPRHYHVPIGEQILQFPERPPFFIGDFREFPGQLQRTPYAAADQDPGRVLPGADVRGASFHSYLTYSEAWWRASLSERAAVEQRLPFRRVSADEPGVNGQFVADRYYSSGGRALNRSSLRSW